MSNGESWNGHSKYKDKKKSAPFFESESSDWPTVGIYGKADWKQEL